MNMLNDPAWSFAALAAAVFGGLLTNLLWKFGRWVFLSYIPKNREIKRQIDECRTAFIKDLADQPILIILNTLYLSLILLLAVALAAVIWYLPTMTASAEEGAAALRSLLCTPQNPDALSCNPFTFPELEAVVEKYLLIARPFILFYGIIFFTWFWSRVAVLLRAYRMALGEHTLGPSSSLRF